MSRLLSKLILAVVIAAGIIPAAVAADYDTDAKYVARMKELVSDPTVVCRLADAIYWAEGGPDTNHPYGILKKYKTTTPRQACINTIYHAIDDWDGHCDFIEFLGSRYCPIGAANDPTGLNKNWIKNVRYFYGKNKNI